MLDLIPANASAGRGKPTIMIADDEPVMRRLLRMTVDDGGVTIIEATDGVDAVLQAQVTHPDIILLDVMMPKLDGFEVCQRLRADPATADSHIDIPPPGAATGVPGTRTRCRC